MTSKYWKFDVKLNAVQLFAVYLYLQSVIPISSSSLVTEQIILFSQASIVGHKIEDVSPIVELHRHAEAVPYHKEE